MCCDSWGHKESDTTEQLNGTELKTNITHGTSASFKLIHDKESFDPRAFPHMLEHLGRNGCRGGEIFPSFPLEFLWLE